MSEVTYDFFVAGRWRNREMVNSVRQALRDAGKNVYCFTDNSYEGDGIKLETHSEANVEKMVSETESLPDWQTNPTFRKIFETDMQALRDSAIFVLVFPAGLDSHMELGVAYGMGKTCYAVGQPEKTETLYLMIDKLFPDTKSLVEHLV